MKYRCLLSVAAAFISLVSCQKNEGVQPGPDPKPVPDPVEPVTLTLNSTFSEQTKTALGPLQDGIFPVYWTDGDRICVNGVKSSTLYNLEPNTVQAKFTVQGPKAPYHIVYPSIICSSMTDEGLADIDISSVQSYTKDSFAPLSAILYGSTEGTEGTLKNLCGVVRIPLLKGAEWGANVKTITISSSNAANPLAGKFTLDTKTGSLVPVNASSSVLLSLPVEGIDLDGTEPQYFFITLPAGEYPDGFSIILGNEEGNMMCSWVEETAVAAGVVATLPQIEFKPNNTKLIDSVDSYNEFVAAVNAGDYDRWIDPETNEAVIVNDISFGGNLEVITALPEGFVLNGGGHIIKRANATEPLIELIAEGATVKNLTVGGTRIGFSTASNPEDRGTGNLASFNRGVVENCVNDMAVILSAVDKNVKIGGLVTDNAGVLKDCKNLADITINMNITANRTVYGGALAAIAHRNLNSVQYCGDFINCENKGSIVINRLATKKSPSFSLVKFSLGGIVGCIEQGTADGEYTLIENCTNSGNIIYYQDENHTNANYGYSAGGILGRNCVPNTSGGDYYYQVGGATATSHNGYYFEMKNCTNTGTVDVSIYSSVCSATMSGARLVYHGGLVGCLQSSWSSPALISDCAVRCDLRQGNSAMTTVTGGLFGGLGYANVENCTADVAISLSKNDIVPATHMGYGGGIAGVVLRDATLKNCEANIKYDVTGATAPSGTGAGFVGVVLKNGNIKEHVSVVGMASLTLDGTNRFGGTIKGVPVTDANVAASANQGRINGNITIK